jgi:integration host factor subunit beta
MTKSELIELIARKQPQLSYKDIELVVKTSLEHMVSALSTGERIEIRGFGSFSLHYRPSRIGRNPKSGEPVSLSAKYVPHFKPGKDLREGINDRLDDIASRGGVQGFNALLTSMVPPDFVPTAYLWPGRGSSWFQPGQLRRGTG